MRVRRYIEKEFGVKLAGRTKSVKIKDNAFVHFDNVFEWPNPNDSVRREKGYCHGLSTHIGVLSDGTVVPCCLDADGNMPLGNVNQNSISEIFNMPRAVAMKKGFLREN